MKTALVIFQIILSVALIVLIFLQSSGDNESRGNLFSTTSPQRRGWEKVIFTFTLIVFSLFIISSIVQTIL
ncbi:MAG: preprotein translocase subunit SecG [Candidatus Shapirobacteria bacterium]|jgi:protein translocase SecG subunit